MKGWYSQRRGFYHPRDNKFGYKFLELLKKDKTFETELSKEFRVNE